MQFTYIDYTKVYSLVPRYANLKINHFRRAESEKYWLGKPVSSAGLYKSNVKAGVQIIRNILLMYELALGSMCICMSGVCMVREFVRQIFAVDFSRYPMVCGVGAHLAEKWDRC